MLVRVARSCQDVQGEGQQIALLAGRPILAPPEGPPAIVKHGGRGDKREDRGRRGGTQGLLGRQIRVGHRYEGALTHRDGPSPDGPRAASEGTELTTWDAADAIMPGVSVPGTLSPAARS